MSVLTIIGFVIFALALVIDRFVHKLPNWLIVPAYVIAVACLVIGLVLAMRGRPT